MLKLRKIAPNSGRKLVAELWHYPDNQLILELSTKTVPGQAVQVAGESRAFLSTHGVDMTGEQRTKTKTALEFFAGEIARRGDQGGGQLTRRVLRRRATAILRSEQRLEDRYVLAGFLIVACIVAFAAIGNGRRGRFVAVLLEGVTLIVILRASRVRPRVMQVVSSAVGIALIAVAVSSSSDNRVSEAAPVVLGALLALGAPIAIVRRLRDQPAIDFMTVAGALCIYLLAGLFFALLYWSMGVIAHSPFFAQKEAENAVDYVYYSFVTLTTVGYGDLTARQDPGPHVLDPRGAVRSALSRERRGVARREHRPFPAPFVGGDAGD